MQLVLKDDRIGIRPKFDIFYTVEKTRRMNTYNGGYICSTVILKKKHLETPEAYQITFGLCFAFPICFKVYTLKTKE